MFDLDEGKALFNAGFYWEAHEAWEIHWQLAKKSNDLTASRAIQGLILYSAAIHKRWHYQSLRGGTLNLTKARKKLEGLTEFAGIDLAWLDGEVEKALNDKGYQPQLP